jgi:hypothetical protein
VRGKLDLKSHHWLFFFKKKENVSKKLLRNFKIKIIKEILKKNCQSIVFFIGSQSID